MILSLLSELLNLDHRGSVEIDISHHKLILSPRGGSCLGKPQNDLNIFCFVQQIFQISLSHILHL